MKDEENKDYSAPFSSAESYDASDDVFLYENALKNLRRELEEKQGLIAHLQRETARNLSGAKSIYPQSTDEYAYMKNKDMVQKIKDQAADVLISELKYISNNMRRKLNEMNEKENRIATRLIEIEERQAILEEIDYIQRMIPKKIFEEKMQQSVEMKREAEIDVKDIFRPAVHMILEKEQSLQAEKPEAPGQETAPKNEITDSASDVAKQEPLQDKAQNIRVQPKYAQPPHEAISENIDQTPEVTDVSLNVEDENRMKESIVEMPLKVAEENTRPHDFQVAAAAEKVAQSEESTRRGGNGEHFSYISDSKIKLKPEDMLSIQKTIRSLEQGRFAAQGD